LLLREASQVLAGPAEIPPAPHTLEQDIRDALLASKIISYAQVKPARQSLLLIAPHALLQGFMLLKQAAVEYKWDLQYGNIALMWRGGCIIRSVFLGNIKEAFDKNPSLPNLMLDPWFTNKLRECSAGWRRVVALGALSGVPTPCFSSALSFYDGYRCI
jgi:6-phosphogluconate dehydrogenase